MTCEQWLQEYLSTEGAALCEWVRAEAKRLGYSKADLKKARKVLGVKTHHQYDEYGATLNWFWYLGG